MARQFLSGVDLGGQAVTAINATTTTNRLLGRSTAGTGPVEEITVGSGLSLSAGTLTATGGGSGGSSSPAAALFLASQFV